MPKSFINKRIKLTLAFCGLSIFINAQIASDNQALKQNFVNARHEIELILKDKKQLDFQHAVFIIESPFNENKHGYSEFCENINFHLENVKLIAKEILSSNVISTKPNKFVNADSAQTNIINYVNNYAIFKYITDTTYFASDNSIFYNPAFKYSSYDPFATKEWQNSQVNSLLDIKRLRGNCNALVSLFKILSERLNSNGIICTTPNHIFIRHADINGIFYNVELASKSFPGTGTIETITYTTDEAARKGIAMRELNLKQSIGLQLINLAKSYQHKFDTKTDAFILDCANLCLKHDSLNVNAMLLKAEYYNAKINMLKKPIIQIQTNVDFIAYQHQISSLYSLGYREMPTDMKNKIISMMMNDSTYLTLNKSQTYNPFPSKKDYNRAYSLSGGMFEEVNTFKPKEQFFNTVYDAKTKKIINFNEVTPLYNNYEIDPVILALNIDPKASQMPGWSPYNFVFNNPLIFVDPDGQYPIYVLTRSYAPFKTFGPGNKWAGDNRGATLSRGASYRSLASIHYDTETKITDAFGGKSRSHTIDGSHDAMSSTSIYNRSKGNNIDVQSVGRNEAQAGSWDIDQFTKLKVVTEGDIKNDHVLSIKGSVSGDDFPNQESAVYDSKGNAIWLGNYETSGNRQWGPVTDLPRENESDVQIKIDVRIKVNKEGVFQGVMQKDKDGKESVISLEQWNSKFKSDDKE